MTENTIICSQCTTPLNKRSRNSQKLCPKCYQNWKYHNNPENRTKRIDYQRQYYLSKKDDPEYKAKVKERVYKWISDPKNRERWLANIRERAKINFRKKYKLWKEQGKCTKCGKDKTNTGTVCDSCKILIKSYRNKRKIEKAIMKKENIELKYVDINEMNLTEDNIQTNEENNQEIDNNKGEGIKE